MNTVTKLIISESIVLFSVALFWSGAVLMVPSAHATSSAPVLVLTLKDMNNVPVAAAVNDEPLKLEWYVDGPVTNCAIMQNNSVSGQSNLAMVDTNSLPETDSMVVTPPANSTTNYILNCDADVEEVPVNTDPPVVTMSVDEGVNLVNNAIVGRVDKATVRWSSVNATRCSYVDRVSSSTVVTETFTQYDYTNPRGIAGSIVYDGWPREIHETTTFSVTCYNDNTGAEDTGTITINVSNPPAPGAPLVTVGSPDYPSVDRDPLYGYAFADVWYTANNVTSCSRKAYYPDGVTEYSLSPWTVSGSAYTSYSFPNLALATTTVFEVTCTRAPVTLGGVTYPATSSTDRMTIVVQMPGNIGDAATWDRSGLPPVFATLEASPNPVTKNALTGHAVSQATLYRENGSYCYLKAYQFSALSGGYTNEYVLPNWTRTLYNNGTTSLAISVPTTTRLVADCWREYDRLYGDAAEIANGHAIVETLLVVHEPAGVLLPPRLHLYGNAVHYSVSQLWNIATERIGFDGLVGTSPQYIENSAVATTSNRISFPFTHPFGGKNDYDIWLQLCDENDGESDFRVYVAGVLVGQHTTNDLTVTGSTCSNAADTTFLKLFAQDIEIQDGDVISVECDTPNDGEACRFIDIRFGAPGTISTPQVNPVVTEHDVKLMVIAENVTNCGGGVYPHEGYRMSDMSVFNWWSDRSALYYSDAGFTDTYSAYSVSTTSKLTLGCWRTGDGLIDVRELNILVPYKSSLRAEASIGVGQCYDDGTHGNPFGTSIEAPVGYGPDENGFCSPMVDLAAESPAVSIAGATEDAVNGQYDNLSVLMAINNLGPGELEPNGAISYKGRMEIMPAHGLPDAYTPTGFFNGALGLPVPSQSPTLTREFNDIPFGTHRVCSRVNLDGVPDNYPEASTDYTNNTSCTNVTLPVPRPPMHITPDRPIIRYEQPVGIGWGVNVTYELQCMIQGPGGLSRSFNTLATGPGYTDLFTTAPLSATSEYTLTCTEPITNTTFTETQRVEMVPEVEEV